MVEQQPNCVLCGGRAKQEEGIRKLFDKYTTDLAVYAESKHFIASPDLHPIVEDPYFLIFPKEHLTSFELVPAEWDYEMHEIGSYLKDLCQKDSVVIFEHGQMKDGNKVKSVYHAHTHIIPTNSPNILASVEASVKDLGGAVTPVVFDSFGTVSELNKRVKGDYLLFRQDGAGLFVSDNGTMDIPSQYFRVLLQELFNPMSRFINWKSMDKNEENLFKRRLMNYPRRI